MRVWGVRNRTGHPQAVLPRGLWRRLSIGLDSRVPKTNWKGVPMRFSRFGLVTLSIVLAAFSGVSGRRDLHGHQHQRFRGRPPRQAITDANAAGGADTIEFNIVGSGVHTIVPALGPPADHRPARRSTGTRSPEQSPTRTRPSSATNAAAHDRDRRDEHRASAPWTRSCIFTADCGRKRRPRAGPQSRPQAPASVVEGTDGIDDRGQLHRHQSRGHRGARQRLRRDPSATPGRPT